MELNPRSASYDLEQVYVASIIGTEYTMVAMGSGTTFEVIIT